jgi:hypothetical protein
MLGTESLRMLNWPDIRRHWSSIIVGYWVPLDTWIFSDRDKLSAVWSCGTWPDYCMRNCAIWGFECWLSYVSLPVCFQLSVWAIRCYSHLSQPCEVFHNYGGKTGGTLIDQSHDVRQELGDTSEVAMLTGVRKCDRSRDIRPESGMRPKSHKWPKLWYTCNISMYNG